MQILEIWCDPNRPNPPGNFIASPASCDVVTAVAIVPVRAVHQARYESIINSLNSEVLRTEPACVRDLMLAETSSSEGTINYVMIESYESQAALEAHFNSTGVKAAIRAFEDGDLLTGPILVLDVRFVGGFVR